MADQVHLTVTLLVPQVDVYNVHGMVYLVDVNLLAGCQVRNDEPHAWWGRDGTTVLVTKATHTGPFWLLRNVERVSSISSRVFDGDRLESWVGNGPVRRDRGRVRERHEGRWSEETLCGRCCVCVCVCVCVYVCVRVYATVGA
jgi:hypothetical protein